MIQRIQSLYFLLTTLLSLLFLKGSILNFINNSGSAIRITFTGIVKSAEGEGFEVMYNLLPLSVIILVIPVLSLVTIFFFKNRSVQLWLSKILIALVTGLILISVYCSYLIITQYNGELVPGIKMTLPLLQLVLSILAFTGIRKDDRLVKSYDRLR